MGGASKRFRPCSGKSSNVPSPRISAVEVLIDAELPPVRAPKLSDLHGKVIAERYFLGKKLGEGGMGTVFLADDLNTRDQVAIKLIKHEMADNHELKRRFLREMEVAQRINHPNVVRCLGGGEHDGCLYFVMEYLQGSTLQALLDSNPGPKPPETVIPLILQICDGVQAAHNLGIVHRDLKPENIFIAEKDGFASRPGVKVF